MYRIPKKWKNNKIQKKGIIQKKRKEKSDKNKNKKM
jgi:hypothetical protein